MNPSQLLPVALMAFGRQMGLLKPAASAAVRGAGEVAENIAKKGLGLIGERPAAVTRAPSPLPTSVRGFIPSPGAARPSIPSAATAAPVPRAVPEFVQEITRGRVNRPVGFEGKQLDMFSGMNRLTYPAGTRTAEGFAVGGKTFNPADVMPEGEYTQRIRELARSKGVPEELFMEQMLRPGKSLADEVNLSAIPSQTGLFAKPVEFGAYQARNLIKQNIGNLAELVRANPRLAAALGAGTGVGIAGVTMAQMNPSAPSAPELPSPMGPTTANPEVGLVSDPQVAQQQQMTMAQTIAAGMSPSARAVIPEASYTGAGGQPVMTIPGYDEAFVSNKQQYAKPKSDLQKYYAQREAYAKYPAYKAEIISELQKRGVLDTPELVTWAGSNPTLAYELLRKATGSNTLPSQQTPQPTQAAMISPMGSNLRNNAMGSTMYASESVVGGSAGASDIYNATVPQVVPEISKTPAEILSLINQRAWGPNLR